MSSPYKIYKLPLLLRTIPPSLNNPPDPYPIDAVFKHMVE
jgi:hypothetical protein